MKVFIVLAVLTIGASVAQMDERLFSLLECFSRFGPQNEAEVEMNLPVNQNCFNSCYLQLANIMTEYGYLNKTNVLSIKNFPEEEYNRITGECDKLLAEEPRNNYEFPCKYTECLRNHEFFRDLVKAAAGEFNH